MLYTHLIRIININNNNESTEVQTLGVIRIQLIYSINVLSKYSSLISHRPSTSKADTSTIDHRSSKVNTSISEGGHIDLRRSTHRSPKVDTSIFEGRHIVTSIVDLRKAIYRSSKVATSIFESRHIDFRRSKAETSHLQFATKYCPQLQVLRVDEVTHTHKCIYIIIHV